MSQSFATLGNQSPSQSERALLHEMILRDRSRISLILEEVAKVDMSLAEAVLESEACTQRLEKERSHWETAKSLIEHYKTIVISTKEILFDGGREDENTNGQQKLKSLPKLNESAQKMLQNASQSEMESRKVAMEVETAVGRAKEDKRLVEMKVFYLQSEKNTLLKQIKEIDDLIQQKQRHFSVLRRVPFDIWYHIFEYAVEISLDVTSEEATRASHLPPCYAMVLCTVCHDWRTICDSRSRLWTRILLLPNFDTPRRLKCLLTSIKKADYVINLLVVVSSDQSARPNHREIFKEVKNITRIKVLVRKSEQAAVIALLSMLPPCREIYLEQFGGPSFSIELPKEFFQNANSLVVRLRMPRLVGTLEKLEHFEYLYPTGKLFDTGLRVLRAFPKIKRLSVDALIILHEQLDTSFPLDRSLPHLLEVQAPINILPLIFAPSIIAPNLCILRLKVTTTVDIKKWRIFLNEHADGRTIEVLSLSMPHDLVDIKIPDIIEVIFMLPSINRLELYGALVEPIISYLIDTTPTANSIEDRILFPLLTSLILRDYDGNGETVADLMTARQAAHCRLDEAMDVDYDGSGTHLVSKLEKVEWYNCTNVLPTTRWNVISLFDE